MQQAGEVCIVREERRNSKECRVEYAVRVSPERKEYAMKLRSMQ
jgi:hypothetical protein